MKEQHMPTLTRTYFDELYEVLRQQFPDVSIYYVPTDYKMLLTTDPVFCIADVQRCPEKERDEHLATLKWEQITVIALLETNMEEEAIQWIERGIDHIVWKDVNTVSTIVKIIQNIQKNRSFLPWEVVQSLKSTLVEMKEEHKEIFTFHLEEKGINLTRKEIDVAYLLKKDLKNKQIASILGLAEGTVKIHISNIYKKVGMKQRKQVIKLFERFIQPGKERRL
ncbi:helix-turn-helix transcriptional regulator [Virgibacillus halodenitrificans]|uniref:helix-turn-helix transcriptional regulator n=1 Tax=Virgibacillus halodenitrificans TaxID=1482 RepID=UPI00045D02BD|nr:response regulator transcription factor [Virgibacillus halodenitrificans]CDQ31418.1 transcriptional regulator NarL [Virgibacillus halodenitrificans]